MRKFAVTVEITEDVVNRYFKGDSNTRPEDAQTFMLEILADSGHILTGDVEVINPTEVEE